MFFWTAGSTVAGWRTLAPKYASSAASSKLMALMRRACLQRLGSVVIIPSTSVHISMRSASSPAPTMAAVKSDPPRPMVVVTPSRVDPMKPPITGTRVLSNSGRTSFCSRALMSSNSGSAFEWFASVMMQSRESTCVAFNPRAENAAVTSAGGVAGGDQLVGDLGHGAHYQHWLQTEPFAHDADHAIDGRRILHRSTAKFHYDHARTVAMKCSRRDPRVAIAGINPSIP